MPVTPDADSTHSESESANEQVLGLARAQAIGTTYQSLAHAIGLMMLSDQQHRQAMQTLQVAMVSTTCSRILAARPGEVKRG